MSPASGNRPCIKAHFTNGSRRERDIPDGTQTDYRKSGDVAGSSAGPPSARSPLLSRCCWRLPPTPTHAFSPFDTQPRPCFSITHEHVSPPCAWFNIHYVCTNAVGRQSQQSGRWAVWADPEPEADRPTPSCAFSRAKKAGAARQAFYAVARGHRPGIYATW